MEKVYMKTNKNIEEEVQKLILREKEYQSILNEHEDELKTFFQKLK